MLHALDDILASPHFCNSKRYPALLKYIVENSLAGRAEVLKERTLGVEVFDRPASYDTNTDTVVRYTAGEVRKRLLLYYSELGRTPDIRISLPAGSYVPEFFNGAPGGDEPSPSSTGSEHPADAEAKAARDAEIHPPTDLSLATSPSLAPAPPLSSVTEKKWRRVAWPALAAVLLAAIAAIIWRDTRVARMAGAVDDFWSPVVRDQHTVVVCAGSVVFDTNKYSGVITAEDNADYPFFSMQITSAITEVTSVLDHSGVNALLRSAPSTSLTELREHSVALLGAYNNRWTLQLIQPLRYHFIFDSSPASSTERIVDATQPQTVWERDRSKPYSSADDYAIVARFRDPRIDGWIVVLAGLGRNGTEAAAQFATSPHYLEELRQRLGGGFGSRNIEAVLKISVIKGETGAPSIIAVHSW